MKVLERARSILNCNTAMALILFVFSYCLLSLLNPNNLIVSIYQSRDIHHSFNLLNGEFVWYGPDFFGGGKTPGPFYYWLLALPLLITKTWHSLLPFSNLLAAASLAWLYLHLQKMYSRFVALFAVVFLLSNSIYIENLKSFWNPSYLPIFLMALIWFFTTMSPQKPLRLFSGFLILSLAAQVHFSMIIFLLPALFSLNSLEYVSLYSKIRILLLSLLIFLLPFIPYLLIHYNDSFADGALALSFPFRKWIHNIEFDLSFFKNIFNLIKVNIFLLPCCLLFFINPEYAFKKNKFLNYSFILSMGTLVWLCYNPLFFRYTVPFFVLLAIAQAIHLEKIFLQSKKYFRLWLAAVAANFIYVAWPVQANETPLYNENGYFSKQSFEAFQDVAQVVVSKTGWSYEEFRQKTYILGLSRETDISLTYQDALSSLSGKNFNIFTGVLAVRQDAANFINDASVNWNSLHGLVPNLFIQLGEKNELICTYIQKTSFFQYCFYKINNPAVTMQLNNIGYSYKYTEPSPPKGLKPGVNLLSNSEALIVVQFLPNSDSTSVSYLHFKLDKNLIRFSAYGDPIGIEDNANNPSLASNFKNTVLTVDCGQQITKIPITEHIGFEKRRKSFLAPLRITLTTDCKLPIKKISISGQHLNLVTAYGYFSDQPFQYNIIF